MQRMTAVFHPLSLALMASIVLLLLTACGSMSRQVNFDPAQNFESMHSYNFSPVPDKLLADPNYQLLQQGNITLAIENTMAAKKIRKETRIEPDFWLNYYFTGDQSVNSAELNSLFAYNLGLSWNANGTGGDKAKTTQSYRHKTLIIDLVSPDKNRLIWRGSRSIDINPGKSATDTRQALQKAAQAILKPFPPKNIFGSLKKGIPD